MVTLKARFSRVFTSLKMGGVDIGLALQVGFMLLAVSLLFNLEAAQQGSSMLFLDEQKLLLESWKKGFVKNTKLDFMRC